MKRVKLNSKVGKVLQGRSRGFSMLEVVIAIALLGIIAVSILGALQTAALALINADQRATAESLARTQMESVKNEGYDPAPDEGEASYTKITGIPDGYAICSVNRGDTIVSDVIGVPWDSGNNTAVYQDDGFQKIRLVIKHDDKVVVTLEGYKRELDT